MNDSSKNEANQIHPTLPTKLVDGRDELNFAEFPLGTTSQRIPPGLKALVFEDEFKDSESSKPVTRRLRITASQEYGLPTATDDEVILGLIQLSKLQKFQDRKVYFSRYQLLKLLRWPPNGENYDRLADSLNRLLGVTFYYKNAWRDPAANSWIDASFHILDNVYIYQEENSRSRHKSELNQNSFNFASSSFTWNEIIFKSLQSGNLKALNYDYVLSLQSAVSRRLFRFLDKRLYKLNRLEMDLKVLAYEHIGLSRKTMLGDIKRTISKAIRELESRNYLNYLPNYKRFKKIKSGVWMVTFEKKKNASA